MDNNILKHPFWLFGTPLAWVTLLILIGLLTRTTWGISGDPSNAIVLFIYLVLSAPLFGIIGIVQALLYNNSHRFHVKAISIALNLCLVIGGAGFWLLWFK